MEEGYVFGTKYTYQVEVAKVQVPSNPCISHRFLDKKIAQ
jgi:hypothetical protein